MHAKWLQLCLNLCKPMDHSPPDSSVHGILQARILVWVAISSSRGSSQPRDQTHIFCLLHWQADSLPLMPPGNPQCKMGTSKRKRQEYDQYFARPFTCLFDHRMQSDWMRRHWVCNGFASDLDPEGALLTGSQVKESFGGGSSEKMGSWNRARQVTFNMFCSDIAPQPGLPGWLRWLRIRLQCRRPGFNPWVEKICWRRVWQPTPVFFPGEPHGQKSLGSNPWGHKESDTTEWLTLTLSKWFNFHFFL